MSPGRTGHRPMFRKSFRPILLSSRAKSRDLWSYRTRYSFAIFPPIIVGRLCQTPTVTTRRFTETPYNSFAGNLSAPGEYLRLSPSCFGFLDVAGAVVKQPKTRPADLFVRPKPDGFFPWLDPLGKTPEFHQRHAERVPPIEKIGGDINAALILCRCAFKIADG